MRVELVLPSGVDHTREDAPLDCSHSPIEHISSHPKSGIAGRSTIAAWWILHRVFWSDSAVISTQNGGPPAVEPSSGFLEECC